MNWHRCDRWRTKMIKKTQSSRTVRRRQRQRHLPEGQTGLHLRTNGPANAAEPLLRHPCPPCLVEQTLTPIPASSSPTLVRPKLLLPPLLLALLHTLPTQPARTPEDTCRDRQTRVVVVVVTHGPHATLKTPERWGGGGFLAPIKHFGM